jgi:hypothetical protein
LQGYRVGVIANHIILNPYASPVMSATNNWWNSADGPSGAASGSGESISANIAYTPFLTIAPLDCVNNSLSTLTLNLNWGGDYGLGVEVNEMVIGVEDLMVCLMFCNFNLPQITPHGIKPLPESLSQAYL